MKLLLILALVFTSAACSMNTVTPGNVGVKVYMLGGSKGVDHEVLPVGRYFLGMNERLYVFPVFQQNYTWTRSATEGSPTDESITFQTKEGMDVNVDVGISYHLNPDKVANIFQKYRKGIDEITDIYLRNDVRDAISDAGSQLSVQDVYGSKKAELLDNAKAAIAPYLAEEGIVLDKLYVVGTMRLPENVVAALNSKIEATQRAQQRQNEVQEALAQADKARAEAHGQADSVYIRAKAEADANRLKQASLTDSLIRYESIQKWDGKLPNYMGGGAVPFVTVK